jgi:surface carbohydrate biosynthesis protein
LNIYINVEIASRELDSKLLLATLAATKGHHVVVSDLSGIMHGIQKGVFAPGIFHDKSLTPNANKIATHQFVIDNGFVVTSIDEENNLINYGYDKFAMDRYSEQTIGHSAAIFGWGSEDVKTLEEFYPKHSARIHMTGSPRIDLLQPLFSDYWGIVQAPSERPYLLVVSNCQANNLKPFHETLRLMRGAGYFKRDPQLFKKKFEEMAESYHRIIAFIEAIKHLADNNSGYDIILRPHPAENVEAWKIFLEGIPRVYVVQEGSVIPWINNSFALIHNGCTTAIEATVLGKPVITYIPFKLEHYTSEVPNNLGFRVESLKQLLSKVNNIYYTRQSDKQKNNNVLLPELISKKIYIDNNELAAEKIVKIWESIANKEITNLSSSQKFTLSMRFIKHRQIAKKILNKFFENSFRSTKENYKFPPLDERDICDRINKLQNILKIDKRLECKVLSDRTVLIKNGE